MGPKSWKWILALLAVFAATAAFTSAKGSPRSDNDEAKVREAATQSTKAAEAFDAIMGAPDKAIPQDLLARAKAIAVFPRVIKAAFLVGGEGGRGCVSRRTKAG
jgi:lipid-binding SYLF domain-containing protein